VFGKWLIGKWQMANGKEKTEKMRSIVSTYLNELTSLDMTSVRRIVTQLI
jgi:hypothetical protein